MSCSHVVVAEVERGDFGHKGKESDWEVRNEALLALQRLFDEAATLEVPADKNAEAAFDAEAWCVPSFILCSSARSRDGSRPARRRRALRLPLQTCLKDLRSQLVREACALLVCIARACNGADGLPVGHVSRDGGRQCLRDAVPTLLEVLSSGNRLNARFVDDCLLALIKLCRFKQFVGAVAEYATPARRGRSAAVREACAAYATEMLRTWGAEYLGKHDDAVRMLQATIGHLVEDSSERARASAREAFAEFAKLWPDRADDVASQVDPRVGKLLDRARAGDDHPPAASHTAPRIACLVVECSAQ